MSVEQADLGLMMTLEFDDHEVDEARSLADMFARRLGRFVTLRFSGDLDTAIVPKRANERFVPTGKPHAIPRLRWYRGGQKMKRYSQQQGTH